MEKSLVMLRLVRVKGGDEDDVENNETEWVYQIVTEGSAIMKGGELTDFLDRVYYGEELIFLYKDKKYFLQGWWSDDGKTVEMELCIINENLEMIWHQKAMKMAVCAERFLSEKLWDGKDFLQAQEDMTWSDW